MNGEIRILLAQSEKSNVEFLSSLLKKAGYQGISVAFDGIDAIRFFEEHTPDVVFLDPALPFINGISVLKKIKKAAPDCIVAITASGYDKTDAEEFIKNGSDGYITEFLSEDRVIPWLIVSLASKERDRRLREEYYQISAFLDNRLSLERVVGKFASEHSVSYEEAERQLSEISESKKISLEKLIEILK